MADPVDHPPHYQTIPGVECIDVVEHMNFNRGNAVKYIWRAGSKGDEIEDLRKARWYLDREIALLSRQSGPSPSRPAFLTPGTIFSSTRMGPATYVGVDHDIRPGLHKFKIGPDDYYYVRSDQLDAFIGHPTIIATPVDTSAQAKAGADE